MQYLSEWPKFTTSSILPPLPPGFIVSPHRQLWMHEALKHKTSAFLGKKGKPRLRICLSMAFIQPFSRQNPLPPPAAQATSLTLIAHRFFFAHLLARHIAHPLTQTTPTTNTSTGLTTTNEAFAATTNGEGPPAHRRWGGGGNDDDADPKPHLRRPWMPLHCRPQQALPSLPGAKRCRRLFLLRCGLLQDSVAPAQATTQDECKCAS